MPVSIDNRSISRTDVTNAAKDAGLSKADLTKLGETLTKLAENMSFGDGKALAALATEITDAAATLGHATAPAAQAPVDTARPSVMGTAHTPGT